SVSFLLYFLYGSVSLVTVLGNALVIAAIIIYGRSMRTTTNMFIINLSLADVALGLFSTPFQFQASMCTAISQTWSMPHFVCTVSAFVKEMSISVSVSTLVVISIERYKAVLQPLKPGWSSRKVLCILLAVWVLCVISAIPTALAYRLLIVSRGVFSLSDCCCCCCCCCDINDQIAATYAFYLAVVQYMIPLLLMSVAYSRIIYHLSTTARPGFALDSRDTIIKKNKEKVVKMLVVVVIVFALCWLPLQTYNCLSVLVPSVKTYRHVDILWLFSNWLAMSNSCYNPFIYGIFN
ncbi:hypothetical protein HELRODRAFT_119463, partial [Helobdella robusta]|uniref:G-protein coupled receptors family 1 profile domain-containing protein n=1 Tax=Helobdella robusta TaxID=6412 RepID=T1EGN2_HELRO